MLGRRLAIDLGDLGAAVKVVVGGVVHHVGAKRLETGVGKLGGDGTGLNHAHVDVPLSARPRK